jgi:phosphoribosyl 1,2-cyclic phosphodiesterase
MELRFCALYSGSSGNALYIGTPKAHVLIDAGLPGSRIQESLRRIGVDPQELDAVLITHEHSDHIRGAGVLSRRYDLPVYATEKTWCAMDGCLGAIAPKNRRIFDAKMDFYIKDLNIQPYALPHDAVEPVGYCLYWQNKKIAVATDLGHTNQQIINTLRDADLLVLESNHDEEMLENGPYPYYLKQRIKGSKGHLSNAAAGNALVQLLTGRFQHVLLGHLSAQNNTPQRALATVTAILKANRIDVGREVCVGMTWRDRESDVVCP